MHTVAVADLPRPRRTPSSRSGLWHEITQDHINQFAAATGDHQWIHVDPGRAAAARSAGRSRTVTWSFIAARFDALVRVHDATQAINYGLGARPSRHCLPGHRCGSPQPWRRVEPVPAGFRVTFAGIVACDASRKPACADPVLYRLFRPPDSAGDSAGGISS
jgi:hypothetical protein